MKRGSHSLLVANRTDSETNKTVVLLNMLLASTK